MTAESFGHAIERAVELTKLDGVPLSPPVADIVGAQAYYAGKARHISGVSARDDELVLGSASPSRTCPGSPRQ